MLSRFGKYLNSNVKEWVDSPLQLERKIQQLSSLIKSAKYPIFFTGAGCSTSIGIPDYRSGNQTIVKTGPGIWNRKKETKPSPKIEYIVDRAVPSLTHMSIKTLLSKNIFKFLVSQNTDGLHLRSGVDFSQIAQLHGNRNLQACPSCNTKYFRDFRTIRPNKKTQEEKRDHRTGRKCQNCSQQLYDSIIYFGEKLPKDSLVKAFQEAAKSDLCVCIGSSLTVKPSINVPIIAKQSKANLCIVNIQQTPLDAKGLKINGFCDQVMSKVMHHLQLQVQEYKIQHYFELSLEGNILEIKGKDKYDKNYMFIKQVQYDGGLFTSDQCFIQLNIENCKEIYIKLYGEKPLIELDITKFYKLFHGQRIILKVQKNQYNQQWAISQIN